MIHSQALHPFSSSILMTFTFLCNNHLFFVLAAAAGEDGGGKNIKSRSRKLSF